MSDKGWECPRCGTIHAPWVSECRCTPDWIGTVTGASTRKEYNSACGNFEPPVGGRSYIRLSPDAPHRVCRNCGRPRYAHPEVQTK